MKTLKDTNVVHCWKEVKSLSGVSCAEGQWYHQLIDKSESITLLCERINTFFCSLTSDFDQLTVDDILGILAEASEIPADLYVSLREADIALRSIKLRKARSPDGIPNVILKTFSFKLAPVIAAIYKLCIATRGLPSASAQVGSCQPHSEAKPPRAIDADLRPISFTCQISKVLEGFTLSRILPKLLSKLDSKQFAAARLSRDQALVFLLHLALEALDRGNCTIWFFFADFRKVLT